MGINEIYLRLPPGTHFLALYELDGQGTIISEESLYECTGNGTQEDETYMIQTGAWNSHTRKIHLTALKRISQMETEINGCWHGIFVENSYDDPIVISRYLPAG